MKNPFKPIVQAPIIALGYLFFFPLSIKITIDDLRIEEESLKQYSF